ncbi:unnamed protein product [Pleuronectes platessa]|uniref:Uncharacterized protein n=1 Tax=Pleuronectes platessa TaxID=8262 RepID=A0A9N7YXB3_PLEPL|nr:unnamed protein product [Pleuronectes platessa]
MWKLMRRLLVPIDPEPREAEPSLKKTARLREAACLHGCELKVFMSKPERELTEPDGKIPILGLSRMFPRLQAGVKKVKAVKLSPANTTRNPTSSGSGHVSTLEES